MLRIFLSLLMVWTSAAKALPVVQYGSPVNYEILLAGNFGEPRPNHFHGGVDVKTGGVEGKPIFSIGDGYVSHVTIGFSGFGNAVYVRHPEGYTSVYCHLKKFTPQIQAMVRKWQYEHKRATGEMHFRTTDLPVAQGQLIAVSGNTGSSQAPHLHLEIHDTKTWHMLDPLDFIGQHVNDTVAPRAHAFMAYPQEGRGVFCNSSSKQNYGFDSNDLKREFTAWGHVGFGLWANDYMQKTYNHFGIRSMQLLVDDSLVFSSNVCDIPVEQNMQVNTWGDYEHYLRNNVWYMRSYICPGVTLPILTDRGAIIDFNEERPYRLTFKLTDFKGNTSEYHFTVNGMPTKLNGRRGKVSCFHGQLHRISYDRHNSIQLPGLQMEVPPGKCAGTILLDPEVKHLAGALSDTYRLSPTSCPLYRHCSLSILLKHAVADSSKLYVEGEWPTSRYCGGTFRKGWVTGFVRDLGQAYSLAYDDTPPTIQPLNAETWGHSRNLRVKLSDGQSGLDHYEAYVDGQFVLFEEIPKTHTFQCKLEQTPVKPTGRMRKFSLIAVDCRQNRSQYTCQFMY